MPAHLLFLVRRADGQTAQQQGRADAVLGDDDLGVLAQILCQTGHSVAARMAQGATVIRRRQ